MIMTTYQLLNSGFSISFQEALGFGILSPFVAPLIAIILVFYPDEDKVWRKIEGTFDFVPGIGTDQILSLFKVLTFFSAGQALSV